jgi:hypothetical protein
MALKMVITIQAEKFKELQHTTWLKSPKSEMTLY